MLRVFQSINAAAAMQYYTQALSREDYYVGQEEAIGRWAGKAATRLKLAGEVDRDSFGALVSNRKPSGSEGAGEKLTQRYREDRTAGYDLNFHAPKGVSVLHALTNDQRIIHAMRRSVRETMLEIENQAQVRVRSNGRDENRTSGNLVWAEFTHLTARPVDGIPDPHLHMHCYAPNASFDPVEGIWKAGQFRGIKRDAPYFEAVFHNRLARNLEAIGYRTERTATGWDLAGIPKAVVEKFSRRTREIEARATALGITDAEAKGRLGAKTRKTKKTGGGRDQLVKSWDGRLSDVEREALFVIAQGPDARGPDRANSLSQNRTVSREAEVAEAALSHALEHRFERESVVSAKRLVEAALRFAGSGTTPDEVWQALREHPDMLSQQVDDEILVTTKAVLEEEHQLLKLAREGRGRCTPLSMTTAELAPIELTHEGEELTSDQREAINQILTSTDRVTVVRGSAGTGKTRMMQIVAPMVEATGVKIVSLAPTAEASRGVLRSEGFRTADTLTRFLTDSAQQQQAKGGVIWLDEAGLVGVGAMRRLLQMAEYLNARIILSGDSGQHRSVARGDALRLIESRVGLTSARISQVVRQSGLYKQASEALSRGDIAKGVRLLDRMGVIHEIPGEDRIDTLAEEFVSIAHRGESALVVAPTHAENGAVTAVIRARLQEAGSIDPETRSRERLVATQWTTAEAADPYLYEQGLVLQLTKGIKTIDGDTLKRGSRLDVVDCDPETSRITVKDPSGNPQKVDLAHAGGWEPYWSRRIDVSVGDQIRITRNGRTADRRSRLDNGSRYTIKELHEDGSLTLNNGWHVGSDFKHLTHGYCITSLSSQAKTVDHVLLFQGSDSVGAGSPQQFYVSVSRGRKGLSIYTDDRVGLLDSISKSALRRSATELIEDAPNGWDHRLLKQARQVQRMKAVERVRRWTEFRSKAPQQQRHWRGPERGVSRDR